MCGVVYHIECEQRTGNNIGEIARSLRTWIKEHQSRDSSAVLEPCRVTGNAKRYYQTKITPSSAASRRPLRSLSNGDREGDSEGDGHENGKKAIVLD